MDEPLPWRLRVIFLQYLGGKRNIMVTALVIVLLSNVLFVAWRIWVAHFYPRVDDTLTEPPGKDAVYVDKVEKTRSRIL